MPRQHRDDLGTGTSISRNCLRRLTESPTQTDMKSANAASWLTIFLRWIDEHGLDYHEQEWLHTRSCRFGSETVPVFHDEMATNVKKIS